MRPPWGTFTGPLNISLLFAPPIISLATLLLLNSSPVLSYTSFTFNMRLFTATHIGGELCAAVKQKNIVLLFFPEHAPLAHLLLRLQQSVILRLWSPCWEYSALLFIFFFPFSPYLNNTTYAPNRILGQRLLIICMLSQAGTWWPFRR